MNNYDYIVIEWNEIQGSENNLVVSTKAKYKLNWWTRFLLKMFGSPCLYHIEIKDNKNEKII